MNPTEKVGARIAEARAKLGLSKREAARRAGISDSRWRQIESGWQTKNGVRQPAQTTAETLEQIAEVVGLDPDELVTLAEVERSTTTKPVPLPVVDTLGGADFTPREREMMRMFLDWARDVGRNEERDTKS